jgi:hypothetical protein
MGGGEKIILVGLNVVAISAAIYKSIQNLRTLQGYIFRILQHFATKLCTFTHFSMLFPGIYFFCQNKKLVYNVIVYINWHAQCICWRNFHATQTKHAECFCRLAWRLEILNVWAQFQIAGHEHTKIFFDLTRR